MYSELVKNLVGFEHIQYYVVRGITHTHIRINGNAVKIRKPNFQADIFVNRRTQEVSIARIDTKDEKTLQKILEVISHFKF
jgi:hypothetical protein